MKLIFNPSKWEQKWQDRVMVECISFHTSLVMAFVLHVILN